MKPTDEQRLLADRAAAQILAAIPGLIAAGRSVGGDLGAVVALALLFGELTKRGVLPAALPDAATPEVRA